MKIYQIDPLRDPRWPEFLDRHPMASVFHTPGWLDALRRTYGYEPAAVTTCAPGQKLTDGLVFCRISSLLTGRRIVSLPFSDHCEPLVDRAEELPHILDSSRELLGLGKWSYVEIRPRGDLQSPPGFERAQTFYLHTLDLRPELDVIFRSFHKDSVQRKIRRAEREGLSSQEGRSRDLLNSFYYLLLLTRRRQYLPPQPLDWFRNMIDCLGEMLKIRIAFKDGQPVAAIITLSGRKCCIYKYGCSDSRLNSLGGMHMLFWHTIQEAKREGLREFDLGRSDCDNPGLITFKDRWGTSRLNLTYWRTPPYSHRRSLRFSWKSRLARSAFAHAPDRLLIAAGKLLYRHIG